VSYSRAIDILMVGCVLSAAFSLGVIAWNTKPRTLWEALDRYPLNPGVERRAVVEVLALETIVERGHGKSPMIVEPYQFDEHNGVCFRYKTGSMDCFYAEDISEF
jgi:hypothetical protein